MSCWKRCFPYSPYRGYIKRACVQVPLVARLQTPVSTTKGETTKVWLSVQSQYTYTAYRYANRVAEWDGAEGEIMKHCAALYVSNRKLTMRFHYSPYNGQAEISILAFHSSLYPPKLLPASAQKSQFIRKPHSHYSCTLRRKLYCIPARHVRVYVSYRSFETCVKMETYVFTAAYTRLYMGTS
jgi:hypothetical protein